MFEREAALHASVHHENVVRVYASGMAGGEPWLAMELVDGCESLSAAAARDRHGKRLGASLSAYVARQVLFGAGKRPRSARRRRGQPMSIVHRDVTPSNIYLSVRGDVKLGDFGIARSQSRDTASRQRHAQGQTRLPCARAGRGRAVRFASRLVLDRGRAHRDADRKGAICWERPARGAAWPYATAASTPSATRRTRCPRDFTRSSSARSPGTGAALSVRGRVSAALAPFDTAPQAARAELECDRPMGAIGAFGRADAGGSRQRRQDPRCDRRSPWRSSRGRPPHPRPRILRPTASPMTPTGRANSPQSPRSHQRRWRKSGTLAVRPPRGGHRDRRSRPRRPIECNRSRRLRRLEPIDDSSRFLPALNGGHPQPAGRNRNVRNSSTPFRRGPRTRCLRASSESEATGVLFARGRRVAAPVWPHPPDTLAGRGAKISSPGTRTTSHRTTRRAAWASTSSPQDDLARGTGLRACRLTALRRANGRHPRFGSVSSLHSISSTPSATRDTIASCTSFSGAPAKSRSSKNTPAPHVEFPLDLDVVPLVVAGVEAAESTDTSLADWRARYDDVIGLAHGQREDARGRVAALVRAPHRRGRQAPAAARRAVDDGQGGSHDCKRSAARARPSLASQTSGLAAPLVEAYFHPALRIQACA